MKSLKIITAFLLLLSFGSFKLFCQDDDYNFLILKNLEIYQSVLKHLSTDYVYQTDPDKLVTTSIKNMLKTLDPYTIYISGEQLNYLKIISDSKYIGIGIKFTIIDSLPYIIDVLPNSPAENAGLKIGDKILKINGVSTTRKSLQQLQILLAGDPNTPVKLTISNLIYTNPKTIVIQRQKIFYPVTPSAFITQNLGYVKIYGFNEGLYKSFKETLLKFKSQHITGLIIDLRDNPGGLLNQAVAVLSTLLPYNTLVVRTVGRNPKYVTNYFTNRKPIDTTIPVAVLVNSKSASASEIVSGVIQDLDRGVIIGTQTFGKGLVQRIFDLPYNAKVKMTIAQYILPSNRCIQKINYSSAQQNFLTNKKFYTKNHRIVYEHDGIEPDISIKQIDAVSDFIKELRKKYLIRFFASYYLQLYPEFDTTFFNQNAKNLFSTFLKKSNFNYSKRVLGIYSKFLNSSSDIPENLRKQFLKLKDSLKISNKFYIEQYWPLIKKLIFYEILNIKNDNDLNSKIKPKIDLCLQKAVFILKNKDLYNKTLNKK